MRGRAYQHVRRAFRPENASERRRTAGTAAAEPIKQTKRAAPQPAQRLGAHTAAFAAAMRRGAGVNTEYAAALRRLACGRLRRSAALSV